MRWLLCAAALAFAPNAFAADYTPPPFAADYTQPPPVTIGPATFTRWAGFYFGGQVGYSSSEINFSNAASSEISYLLRGYPAILQDQQISHWPVLGSHSTASPSYGGFIGYNVQWEDVILGVELNYNRVSLPASSSGTVSRSFIDSTNLPTGHHYYYDPVTVSAQSSIQLTDIATFRARAGWELGSFLPYGFAGFAVGRANTSATATASLSAYDIPDFETPPLVPLPNQMLPPTSQSSSQSGAFAYGAATGLGMDVALTSNLFVRGEFEYVFFPQVNNIQVSLWSARVGAGVKF